MVMMGGYIDTKNLAGIQLKVTNTFILPLFIVFFNFYLYLPVLINKQVKKKMLSMLKY